MVFVRIRLLPRYMLGRRFQYAFASFGGEGVEINFEKEEIVFPSNEVFLRTIELSYNYIIKVNTMPKPGKDCQEYIIDGIDCCKLHGGPKLYGNDYGDIKKTGLLACPYKTSKGIKYTWTHLAVSYAFEVLKKKGPIERKEIYGVPLLAKITLFSKLRGVGVRKQVKEVKVDINSLGTMFIGASLAYLGRHNISKGGQDALEFYLLPDTPTQIYSSMLQIASLQGLNRNLAAIAVDFIKNLGVGVEPAITLATAVLLHRNEDLVSNIEGGAETLVSGVKLYTVSPAGNRPQLRGGVPLSLLFYKSYEKRTIYLVNALAKIKNNDVKNAARQCIQDLFLQAMSPCYGSFLVDCGRSLAALTQDKKVNQETKALSASLLDSIHKEYSSMLYECGLS